MKLTCKRCEQRRARFRFGMEWRARRNHDVCPQCWRSLRESFRAWDLAQQEAQHGCAS